MTMNEPVSFHLKVWLNAITGAGILLIMAGMIWLMYYYTQPPPPDQSRWTERKSNLAELNARDRELLENYGWLDEKRGLVRLPISRSMELTAKEWQNPAAARSNMLWRVEQAIPPAPPPAPVQPTNAPAAAGPNAK
jgi:hypothetical protein